MSDNTVAVLDSVSRFLDRQHGLYIDGQWRASAAEGRLAVYNPANGQQIATTADANEHDVALAVQSAHKAFSEGVWAQRLPVERERILLRFADLVEQHAEELAQLETLEQGKSINIARAFEVGSTLNWMRYTAGLATKITGQTLDVSIPMPPGAKYQVYTRKEPIGVVAGIVPWNFPLMIGMWKVMPALAAGCSIVIKPSETTPLTLLRIAELASEAGVPPGAFNVVTGRGTVCGKALTEHPLIAKVSFTGSTPVGRLLMRQSSDTIKKVSLELGGNAPFIVFDDADIDAAVEGALIAKYRNAGQTCVCVNRFYIQRGVYAQFAEKFVARVAALQVGNGFEPGVQIGPLINRKARDKVLELLDDALSKGAQVLTGATPHALGGNFFTPTVLGDVQPGSLLLEEEIFGPVAPLVIFDDEAEAIRQANDTIYGLAAYFYTRDAARIWRVSERLEYGMVGINTGLISNEVAPFGGVKQSGLGREGSEYGIEDYLELKYLCQAV
ncbi:NAD-dependent succinate-semialdehyde dehydrogenase [Serratia marcescens]|uniref:NAD-dependent succinate-semialdehyde dehydrogenase n=5 Tax=Serratia TaxID=613 RepID=UPI000F7E6754|nr:NAD-dependent succinate-semialdehyde dehydrogenase [Serratia marcescens]RTF50905.1 NAD-dependent succinate-semialdehyde dehydrogenase [Serratia marcescens]RTG20075.1 NAD-dependent succinate-semialdehyde dehydrogenase [Serratia marcescens]